MSAAQTHAARLALRDGSIADRVLAIAGRHPAVTAEQVNDVLQINLSSCRAALVTLTRKGAMTRRRMSFVGLPARYRGQRPWVYTLVPVNEAVDIRIDLSAVVAGPVR